MAWFINFPRIYLTNTIFDWQFAFSDLFIDGHEFGNDTFGLESKRIEDSGAQGIRGPMKLPAKRPATVQLK